MNEWMHFLTTPDHIYDHMQEWVMVNLQIILCILGDDTFQKLNLARLSSHLENTLWLGIRCGFFFRKKCAENEQLCIFTLRASE